MVAIIVDFFATFSERAKLFLIVFLFSLIGILLSLLIGGLSATLIVIVPAILGILQVTKGIWTPEGGAKSKLGLASLGVAFVAVVSNSQWKPLADSLLEPLIERFPSIRDNLPASVPSIVTLLFLVLVILIVNYFARDTTVMKEHATPIDKEFPEKDYKSVLSSFCGTLLDDLNKIDRETNWSAENFTPLDAEVEIQSGSKRLKKVTDLLTAIRSDRRSRVFLVLGDPGSGKSVALRKLCRDLLKEVQRTGKVPLYVNLREWEPKESWTRERPATVQDVYDFVLNNLKSRGDVFTDDFLKKYFLKMFENGRLFVVLDSFDEIPAVLDVSESSWLIDNLSDVLYRFLGGAHESRGILSSRIFRRPSVKFDAKTILEIRPFTERKIVETLRKSLFYDASLERLLFNERPEFVPIARNPFTAALISSYAKEHDNTLPRTQAELYSSYIERRLDACRDRIEGKNLTNQKIIQAAIDIADAMLKTEALGLEAPIKRLKNELPHHSVEDTIDILKYARLGRLGSGDQHRFSFVHRRFNEYFVVQRLIQDPSRVPQDAIPRDSRWRDALVLYCEVADEADAKRIAEFCWSEIAKTEPKATTMSDPQHLRAIHCLRFLKEAFRARFECISGFRDSLAKFIDRQIEVAGNLLLTKLAVEAVGLMHLEAMDLALTKALDINNPWIDETAFKSCRHVPRLSDELNRKLKLYVDHIDDITFLSRRKDLRFSMKLSNGFASLRRFCNWREVHLYTFLFAVVLSCFIVPELGITLLLWEGAIAYITKYYRVNKVAAMSFRRLVPLFFAGSVFVSYLFSQSNFRSQLPALIPADWMMLGLVVSLVIPWYQILFYFPQIRSALGKGLASSVSMLPFLMTREFGIVFHRNRTDFHRCFAL